MNVISRAAEKGSGVGEEESVFPGAKKGKYMRRRRATFAVAMNFFGAFGDKTVRKVIMFPEPLRCGPKSELPTEKRCE